MDKPSVYIETSIVSYLAADPSRHPVTLRNQQLTHAWWATHREHYALYTSELVYNEVKAGEPRMAERRIGLLETISLLPPHSDTTSLARDLRVRVPMPSQALTDSLHIATATLYAMSYLLTWDSRHIANPQLRPRINQVCWSWVYTAPQLLTPVEMMGEE